MWKWLGVLIVWPDVRILCNNQKQCGANVFNENGKCLWQMFRKKDTKPCIMCM